MRDWKEGLGHMFQMDWYYVQHNDLQYHFVNFHLEQVNNNQNLVWKGIWAVIVRCIWGKINHVITKWTLSLTQPHKTGSMG